MMRVQRIILVCLVLLTIIVTSLVRTSESLRYHSDDDNKSARHRHRHRHVATSVASNRQYYELPASPRRSPWPQEDNDYEDTSDMDEDDDDEDEDYENEPSKLYERNYQQARNIRRNDHARFEPRYALRYHQTGHHSNSWHRISDEEDTDRRRNTRYGGIASSRGHRQRPGRDRTHHEDRRRGDTSNILFRGYASRNHGYEDPDEDPKDKVEFDYDTGYDRNSRKWRFDEDSNENSQDYRTSNGGSSRSRNSQRYRLFNKYEVTPESKGHRVHRESRRNDWKSRNSNSAGSSGIWKQWIDEDWNDRRRKINKSQRKRPIRPSPIDDPEKEDQQENRNKSRGSWSSNKKSRNYFIDHDVNAGTDRKKENDLYNRDYDYDINDDGYTKKLDERRENEEEEEDDDNIWNENDDNDDPDDDYQDFDNKNYYKSEAEPPYKTFDDIIKSLTSEDPTTPKSIIRRGYRNINNEKALRKNTYGNLQYDSRNVTMATKVVNDVINNGRSSNWTNCTTNKSRVHPSKTEVANYSNIRENKKLSNAIGDNNSWKDNREQEIKRIRAKLEESQTRTKSLEQEYDEDYDNNEKDEDLVKDTGEHVTEMQADVTNMEYTDEENETEIEGETSAPLVTSPSTTTTTSRTTTTTTTIIPKPIVTTLSSRITQEHEDTRSYTTFNASQSNGLQQQIHSSLKLQPMTNRILAKTSKGQQNDRKGKGAEIKEAHQYAMKVSQEVKCQLPKPRVIAVRDVYPNSANSYVPHCVILHRCSDDTGCCSSDSMTCVPRESRVVELYIYITRIRGVNGVEKLSFENHTECQCKLRKEYEEPEVTTLSSPQNIRRHPQRKTCKCPSDFNPRITGHGECQCNCNNDQICIKAKRGKIHFSFADRICISSKECATPMCEFGEYSMSEGKCPRKIDKFNAIAGKNH